MPKKLTQQEVEAKLGEIDEIKQRLTLLEQSKQQGEAPPPDQRLMRVAKAAFVSLVYHATGAPPADEFVRNRLNYYVGLINKSTDELEMAKHLEETPQDPRDLNPEVPSALSHVILKALAKKRDQRWPSAAELLRALEGVRMDETTALTKAAITAVAAVT